MTKQEKFAFLVNVEELERLIGFNHPIARGIRDIYDKSEIGTDLEQDNLELIRRIESLEKELRYANCVS
jgi:hypothetical protein